MEMMPKQKICVVIYLTVIDKLLISIFVIIFTETVRNWIWQKVIVLDSKMLVWDFTSINKR